MWLLVFVGSLASAGTLVSAQCSAEISPKSIVVEYGHSFSVNCSSSFNQIAGMGWESKQNGIPLTPGVTSLTLVIPSVSLWKLSPQCYVNLNDKSQCTKRLPVTVYKMPDSVSMPQLSQPGSMVEGEQRSLKCIVTNVAPARNLSLLFHKGNKIVSTNTFSVASLEPVNVSAVYDLIAHRADNGARIWCEAKLNFLTPGLQDTSKLSAPQELIVQYPPTFDQPENETLEVPAVDKIILNCSATGNPALEYSWHSPPPVQQTDMNPNKNQLILARSHQFPGTYSCTASNPQGTTTKYFTLVEAPRNRTTFAAIVGALGFLGVVLILAGLYFVKADGTCSLNKGSYQPTSSGPV
ncbi:cell adhesion molecule 3-like [Platichthys flesus]|uniref:cell adhesion molecule 3-like n=1 Tax=Platichthys flesus TaxID=8260 RepID=UPI002DB86DAC|nr:cell adhesion molecule 3-like [Platichthys flesus]